jgi:RNA polymerase sigma factor (sigma-70 family)
MSHRLLQPLIHRLLRRTLGKAEGVASDADLLQRFVDQNDQTAFESLVWRHGPLVMGTCRRMLRDVHDAEDAFQATFLVLFRKAGSIRSRRSLGSWLFKVAYRVALRARARTTGRHEQEQARLDPPSPESGTDPLGHDVRPILDEQLQCLPEKYRAPLVLHYLEEMTVAQVAEELGWPTGTVSVRLDRAKRLMRKRLLARGLALSAAAASMELGQSMASAQPTAALVAATVRAALADAAAQLPGTVSPSIVDLVKGEVQTMFLTQIKLAAALIVTACLVVGVAVGALQALTSSATEPSAVQKAPAQDSSPSSGKAAAPVPEGKVSDLLPPGALARMGISRFRHLTGVTAVAYSPDGKTLASATGGVGEHGVSLWETATGKEVRVLKHRGWLSAVAFSPDGKLLASGSQDDTLRLWDVSTGKEIRVVKHPGWVSAVAFAPDGKTLAAAGGATLLVWDVATGKEIHALSGHQDKIFSVAFAPDGKTIASGSGDKTVRLWDAATGKEVRTLKGHEWWISSVAFAPDGKTIASGSADTTVRLWDAATGQQVRTLQAPGGSSGSIYCLAYSPDGSTLVAGGLGNDINIRIWQVTTGKFVRSIPWDGVTCIAFSPDGQTLAAGSQHWTIGLWDSATGKELRPLHGHVLGISVVAFAPDGKTLASGSGDMTVRLWETATGREIHALAGHGSSVLSLAFSRDGKTLVSTGADMSVRLWETATGKELRTLQGAKGASLAAAFSPDGRTLAFGGQDGAVRLCEAVSGKETHVLRGEQGPVGAVTFSSDGKTLAAAVGNTLQLWDATIGKEVRTIKGDVVPPGNGRFRALRINPQITSLAFSPDGKVVAAGNTDGKLRLWELATGKEFRSLTGTQGVAYSADGKTLASGSGMTVHLWDAWTGREICTFGGHRGTVVSVGFSPDGKTLATGSSDTTAVAWKVPAHEERPSAPPSKDTLDRWWSQLVGNDAPQAHGAIAGLIASPEASVPFLKERVRPVTPADAKQLERWLADLNSDQFAVRQKASQELEQMGDLAEPRLRRALNDKPSLDVQQRIGALLDKLHDLSGERLRLWRVILALEAVGTPEAQAVLRTVAAGAPASRLTKDAAVSLERLANRAGGR